MQPANDTIRHIRARHVLDSRGNPTVEVDVLCQGGASGRAIVPSGASTGKHEAVELRDGDPRHFRGKGVLKAVANVNDLIAPALIGFSTSEQSQIDSKLIALDGTPNKSCLGANAILGVSLACVHAAATSRSLPLWQYLATIPPLPGTRGRVGAEGAASHSPLAPSGRGVGGEGGKPAEALAPSSQPRSPEYGGAGLSEKPPSQNKACMPLPMVNMISGGLHAGGNLEFQDFLFLPLSARSFTEALEMSVAVYRALAEVLKERGFESVLIGDEGGFGPRLANNEQALDILLAAFARAGLVARNDAGIALDVASTHFQRDGRYYLRHATFEPQEMVDFLKRLVDSYPILSIEDGMAEDDWTGWQMLTGALGNKVQLIGDDLFVTSPTRLERGIQEGVANSILIKLNQIGTLTETLGVLAQARQHGYRPVISARSGETEDATIADLAVATGAGQIKIGSIARGERLAKYNQLLRIEEQMGPDAPFAGWRPVS